MLRHFKYSLFTAFFLVFALGVKAQNSNNPFEIVPRLDPVVQKAIEEKQKKGLPDNPFDMVRNREEVEEPGLDSPPQILTAPNATVEAVEAEEPLILAGDDVAYQRFIFFVIVGMMVMLTLIFFLLRMVIRKSWEGFLNPNILSQMHRERSLSLQMPFLILYGFFIINAGIFALVLCKYFNIQIANTNGKSLLICIGGIGSFFILRHIVLSLLGYIFPVDKEASTYSFTITVFNIILGLLLVPMILFGVYAPSSMVSTLLPFFLILIGLVYLYLNLRGLLIANRYVFLHKFHFLLYICTVEIAPVMIVVKLLMGGGILSNGI